MILEINPNELLLFTFTILGNNFFREIYILGVFFKLKSKNFGFLFPSELATAQVWKTKQKKEGKKEIIVAKGF